MAEKTNISWANATFNPWLGCTKVSPACDNCYAQKLVEGRFKKAEWGTGKPRVRTSAANWRKPLAWDRLAKMRQNAWQHGIDLHGGSEAACIAAGFIKPARPRVFCASLADVFDNEIDPNWRADLFNLIRETPNLDWLLLTKRIGNATEMIYQATLGHYEQFSNFCPHNVWLGITVCNQTEADRDIPKLLSIPAPIRFLSIEPMLERVSLAQVVSAETGRALIGVKKGIHWVICGGESGKNARPMHTDWVRHLRDQCVAAGVAFHFKQWGEWLPKSQIRADLANVVCTTIWSWPNNPESPYKFGTKVAGRLLDGVEHNGVPE